MTGYNSERCTLIREIIDDFLAKRLATKLEAKAKGLTDHKESEIRASFQRDSWLEDAARRSGQIEIVTHLTKAIHPEIDTGINLFVAPASLPSHGLVGSGVISDPFPVDATGNAAALDIYAFLNLRLAFKSFLDLATDEDADFLAALSEDAKNGAKWASAFRNTRAGKREPSSHTKAKQIYWLVSGDPHDDHSYHVLAPLYPTTLVQLVYDAIQEGRFGDAAKAARDARRKGEFSDCPVREYKDLAIQKLGGSNPQNISQLNTKRHGDNYLLASFPPVWRSGKPKPVLGMDSFLKGFGSRSETKRLVKELQRFLISDPRPVLETRRNRDRLVEAIIEEFVQFTAELRLLEPGWTSTPACVLDAVEKMWLDPAGAVAVNVDLATLPQRIADKFANWLNARLRDSLPVGDPEFIHWGALALTLFKDAGLDGQL